MRQGSLIDRSQYDGDAALERLVREATLEAMPGMPNPFTLANVFDEIMRLPRLYRAMTETATGRTGVDQRDFIRAQAVRLIGDACRRKQWAFERGQRTRRFIPFDQRWYDKVRMNDDLLGRSLERSTRLMVGAVRKQIVDRLFEEEVRRAGPGATAVDVVDQIVVRLTAMEASA